MNEAQLEIKELIELVKEILVSPNHTHNADLMRKVSLLEKAST